MISQDLHIHTTWSYGDTAVAKQQTIELIAGIQHARTIGISDHYEYITGDVFDSYEREIKQYGFLVGTEVSGHYLAGEAAQQNFDYYIYHCSEEEDYRALEILIATGKPVIIAHPLIMGTNLDRIPAECLVEINNRYVWKSNWKKGYTPYRDRFRFVMSSDAHQPNWLNQNVSRYVCRQLGITETLILPEDSTLNRSTGNK